MLDGVTREKGNVAHLAAHSPRCERVVASSADLMKNVRDEIGLSPPKTFQSTRQARAGVFVSSPVHDPEACARAVRRTFRGRMAMNGPLFTQRPRDNVLACLLKHNYAEQAFGVTGRSGGEEQLILLAVHAISSTEC